MRSYMKVDIKRIDGAIRTVEINEDATVRELYDKVRQDLKENWKLTGAFQLSIDVTDSLEKDDSKIKAVGLCNGMTLFAAALSEPYSWDLFVKLPGRPTATIVTLYEGQTCEVLYKKVMELQGNAQPLCLMDPSGDEIPEEEIDICECCLYDGASLTSQYACYKSLIITGLPTGSFMIHVPPNCYVWEVFQEVQKRINIGEELVKEMGLFTGNRYLDCYMDCRITDANVCLSHCSRINITFRQRGGSDPRVQMLQNCANKDVIGVSTPSIRACPFCGALVQHTDACKQMNCPACSKAFCFICLKKNEGGWQCGSWNTKCKPAPRQTYIPG